MKTKRKATQPSPIEYLGSMTNIYGEEAAIYRDCVGYHFRLDYNRKRVNAESYNHAVNTLLRLGYRF